MKKDKNYDARLYPRDMVGYGIAGKKIEWPNQAKLALQIVLNYEEGGENCVLHGDKESEIFLSEIIGALPVKGRHMNMESLYEYGSRRGFWRLHHLFQEMDIPVTVFAVTMALQRNPDICQALKQGNYEIASHGHRWINYQYFKKAEEKKQMMEAIQIIKDIFGERPLGWYTGRTSPYTREMVLEEGGFRYCSDSYADDLPYWEYQEGDRGDKKLLIIPYTLDNNDMKFVTAQGFNSGDQFFTYLKDSFDTLYEEGKREPKMMSVGLHCRLIGKPGRFQALKRFLEYVKSHQQVWICKRIEIADHWIQNNY